MLDLSGHIEIDLTHLDKLQMFWQPANSNSYVGLLNEFWKFKFRNNSLVSFSDCDFSNFVFRA